MKLEVKKMLKIYKHMCQNVKNIKADKKKF